MQSTFKNFVLLTAFFVMATAAMPKVKNRITGNYHIVKGTINGIPANKMLMDRTMSFNKDKTFTGKITIPSGEMPYNQGLYFIGNDSMLIMHQSTLKWELNNIAFVYKYKITGDTLNIKGFYTTGVIGNPNMLQKFFIDESWKRIGKK